MAVVQLIFGKLKTYILSTAVVIGALLMFAACKDYRKNAAHAGIADASISKGDQLAHRYCSGCHLFPEPELLDSYTWQNGVLPAMAPMLGIFKHQFLTYPFIKNDNGDTATIYPRQSVLNAEDWQHVIDYYTALSPDSLIIQQRKIGISDRLPYFKVAAASFKTVMPATSVIKIDTGKHQLLMADLFTGFLYRFNKELQLIDSIATGSELVSLESVEAKWLACNIGEIDPNTRQKGSGFYFTVDEKDHWAVDSSLQLNHLARPVQISAADFNGDGQKDFLVCEYGYLEGAVSLFIASQNGGFYKKTIYNKPGAEKAIISDINHDGLPDIWVLMAQGDEGIFLFTNKGQLQFDQQALLRFPSVYGSTGFQLIDYNKDGFQDILYTAGDNADYSQVLKPYHGLYIFLNDGHNNFKQSYFFQMNGCFKAIATDFDQDGDLDIAAISFFANYSVQPGESFIYLDNDGHNNYSAYTMPESKTGRWISMDAADLDGDGKTDIVLGNFSYGPTMMAPNFNWTAGNSFLLLQQFHP
jgi:hypothetical protein